MTFIGYEPGSKGYQFWDKDSRSVVISRDVKFDESKFPYRKDLDYKNPFADEKRRSISVKNRRKTTDESDTDTEEGLVIPSMSDSDDDHRPSHPAPPSPGAPPPVCQNLSLVCSVVGRHLGCPRCTVIGTQCV